MQQVKGPYDRQPGEPRPKRAPEPWEMYRGMKTGLDPRDIGAEVTELFLQSDSGKAFQAALEEHGYMLVKGDRRGFVILDSAGKEHSLARRIEGVNTKELNGFMRDLDREALPSVEQGKALHQERKIAGLEADRASVEKEIAWEEALTKSAIEKEKIEKRFVEPERGTLAGGKGKERSPFEPPVPTTQQHPQLNRTAPEHWFEDAARATTRDKRPLDPPEHLKGDGAYIWASYNRSHDPTAFTAALDERGILLAAVTKDEADRSYREAAFAKEIGRFAPVYREGEIVAVSENARVYKLNERTTGDDRAGVETFLKKLDRTQLQGIDATKQVMHDRAEAREAYAQLSAIVNPVKPREPRKIDPRPTGRLGRSMGGDNVNAPAALGRAAGRGIGKALDGIANAFESILAPTLTPEQKLEGKIAAQERQAETEQKIDFARYTAEHAEAQRNHDNQREIVRQQQREQDRDR